MNTHFSNNTQQKEESLLSSPQDTHTGWRGETASFTARMLPARGPIQQMLLKHLNFYGKLLEVGCGESKGVLDFLPNRLHPSVTLTEPNAAPNSGVIASTADKLVENLKGEKYDTIFSMNVLDCIAAGGEDTFIKALEGMEAVLKPGGEIKSFHCYGAFIPWLVSLVGKKDFEDCVAIPLFFEKEMGEGITFCDQHILFVKAEQLSNKADGQSESLLDLVNELYLPLVKESLLLQGYTNLEEVDFLTLIERDPTVLFTLIEDDQLAGRGEEACYELGEKWRFLQDFLGKDCLKDMYGSKLESSIELFARYVAAQAPKVGMNTEVKLHQRAVAINHALSPDMAKETQGYSWDYSLTGRESPQVPKNFQSLVYTVITLRKI